MTPQVWRVQDVLKDPSGPFQYLNFDQLQQSKVTAQPKSPYIVKVSPNISRYQASSDIIPVCTATVKKQAQGEDL